MRPSYMHILQKLPLEAEGKDHLRLNVLQEIMLLNFVVFETLKI